MAEKKESTHSEESGSKASSSPVKLIFILLLLLVAGVFGKMGWDKYSTKKKADTYLSEANAFIKDRKFERAEETILLAEETLPGRPETAEVKKSLTLEKEVTAIEKGLLVRLKEREWDKAERQMSSLAGKDGDNVLLKEASEQIRVGRITDQRVVLEADYARAKEADLPEDALKATLALITLDPTNEKLPQWEDTRDSLQREIKERDAKAESLYNEAIGLDQGVYHGELLILATNAASLSAKEKYQTLYEKVSQYPRLITYPDDYATLQEAVNACRAIDTIFVKPGDYHSTAVINKKVIIKGSQEAPIIFHSTGVEGPVLYVGKKGELTINSVMFKHSELKVDQESAYSTVVVSGKATFTSCLFFQSSAHGLHVTEGGEVELLACRAEGNAWDGYAVSGEGSKLVVDSSITTKNLHHGADAWNGGTLVFKASTSEKNVKSGVVVVKGGKVILESATLLSNSHAGLYAVDGGEAEVIDSVLQKNLLAGAYGHGSGAVNIAGSKVLNNLIAGVVLTKGTSWSGLDTITFEGHEGRHIWKDAEFTLEEVVEKAAKAVTAPEKSISPENTKKTTDTEVSGKGVPLEE